MNKQTLSVLAFTAALGFSGAADAGLSSRLGGLAVYDPAPVARTAGWKPCGC
jgi:hypothetical protein